eukprot:2035387-Prymnesium_polylepis.1
MLVRDALDWHDRAVAAREGVDGGGADAAAGGAARDDHGAHLVPHQQRLQRLLKEGGRHLFEVDGVDGSVDAHALVKLGAGGAELDVLERVGRVGARAPHARVRRVVHVRDVRPHDRQAARARERRELVDVVDLVGVGHVACLELARRVGLLEVHVDHRRPRAEAEALARRVGHDLAEEFTGRLGRRLHWLGRDDRAR